MVYLCVDLGLVVGSRGMIYGAHDTVYRASGIVPGGGVLATYVDSDQT